MTALAESSLVLPGMARLVRGAPWGGLTPRPFQEWALHGVVRKLKTYRSTLLSLFCGGGKTTVFGECARLARGKVLILAERDAILDQAVKRIEFMTGEDVELEQADSHAFHSRIVVGSKDSMKQDHRLERFADYGFTLIIVDEAQHATTAGYRKILAKFPGAKILFVTATPTPALLRIVESIAYEYGLVQAMRDGWACPIDPGDMDVRSVDISNIRRTSGGLSQAELDATFGAEKTILGMMGTTYEAAENRQSIVTATSIHNARRCAEVLNRISHPKVIAHAIDSKDERNRKESREVLAGYKNGDYQYLCHVGKAGEGFDAPATACLSMCGATSSWVKFMQDLGRGMRGGARCPVAGKRNCRILDFARNFGRHDIMTVESVLAPPGTPHEIVAAAPARARRKHIDMLTAVTEELEERKKRLGEEAERRRFIVPKVEWTVTKIDPFAVMKVTNPRVYQKIPDDSGPAREKQIKRLVEWKVDQPDNLTMKQAQKLILGERERRMKGMARYAQIKFGLSCGYNVADCTETRALMLFQAIWRNGGKALPRQQAAEILMGREAGED